MKIKLIQGDIAKIAANAAEIAVKTVKSFEFKTIGEVIFVCFDDENYNLYQKII